MTAIWIVLIVLGVILFHLWGVIDRQLAIRYRHVSFDGLVGHLEQFLRRAHLRAIMHVEVEHTNMALRCRKWYEPRQVGYDAYVIFDGFTRTQHKALEFKKALRKQRRKCDFGMAGPWTCWKYHDVLGCKCSNLDEVVAVTRKALRELYGVSDDATFMVYVKGGIENADIQRDGQLPSSVSIAATLSGNWGRPYLRGQQRREGIIFTLGRVIGRIVSRLKTFLFPRGPDDDLRR